MFLNPTFSLDNYRTTLIPEISNFTVNSAKDFRPKDPKTSDIQQNNSEEKAESLYQQSSHAETWKRLESIPSLVKGDNEPILIGGRVVFTSLLNYKIQSAQVVGKMSQFVADYLTTASKNGIALDLGCGSGCNSIPLLKREWTVIAVDNFPQALESYQKNLQQNKKWGFWNKVPKYIENNYLKLIQEDIVTYDYPTKKFDLVICTDVLPYISPKKLQDLMHKIHNTLVLNGTFIGTVFFLSENPPLNQKTYRELCGKLGAHFYPEKDIAVLLEDVGFTIQRYEVRSDLDLASKYYGPTCINFILKK